MTTQQATVAIIGAGITGIATAYYLAEKHNITDVVLIDAGQPMGFTSAQSGENYRNWWPNAAMASFTSRSIDLMEEIARATNNRLNMTRRGYVLATRQSDITALVSALYVGQDSDERDMLRFFAGGPSTSYQAPRSEDWQSAPAGVDILQDQELVRRTFPTFDPEIQSVIHIRRAGDISGQQLGMYMLERLRQSGARLLSGIVKGIDKRTQFTLDVVGPSRSVTIVADGIVNAAGPFAGAIARMLDVALPLKNILQQKLAFEDNKRAIARDQPFSIDLDRQFIDWKEEERDLLRQDETMSWLTDEMPGSIHCRPDGGDAGKWVKLGWAYNNTSREPAWVPPLDERFPEIVLRGAARLNPALKTYYGRLPRARHHYGGWYSMTEENLPLIGPMGPDGAFVNCAPSGFGTMTACAAGELCAASIVNETLQEYASVMSLARYDDKMLMASLRNCGKGLL